MATCPTCGGFVSDPSEEDRLLAILSGDRRRQVYRGRDCGGWWVTYGGGQFSRAAVLALIQQGHIHSCYSDCPDDAYHVGKTIDVAATVEERKKHRHRNDAPHIYTDGTRAQR